MCPIFRVCILLLLSTHFASACTLIICTIVLKSMTYVSLTFPRPGWNPPKYTALWWFTAVNVKPAQGGGLGPVVVGEDHLPAEGEAVQTVLTLIFTIGCTFTTPWNQMDLD